MEHQRLLMRQGASKRDRIDQLHNKAKRRVQRMGIWLVRHDLMPDFIVSAANPCAIVTASNISKAMAFNVANIIVDDDIDAALERLPQGKLRLLFVNDYHIEEPLMHHGDLVLLDNKGEVLRHIDAKSLPKGFPYPDILHDEIRVRPAYYYRQSSVIPYRIRNERAEILMITSSSGHHWVVPKGIHEPGMSAADSAAKEAREEAGIVGLVSKEPLGSYRYLKWKGDCEVTVFAMQVTQELDTKEWEESYRNRRWCTPEQAIATLDQPLLVPLIQQLVRAL